ncbi:UBX domain-containing protein 7 [Condylostylus longicornis]|uniref:UBX domain-containing protein 7 n=1 Tax=Condylostylus longicornis TaxID=2530218 RepID=UPI00244DB0A1|nr:UBX domain-containing protein 7 [Condylostylus longicornis]
MSTTLNESIKQLMEITGLDELRANTILELNNFNLEQAINYHLENADYMDCILNDSDYNNIQTNNESRIINNKNEINKKNKNTDIALDNSNDTSYVSENASLPDIIENPNGIFSSNTISGSNLILDDNIRAPIPSKREQLLLPEEDQFRLHYGSVNSRKRRPSSLFTFCPFRDFAREAQIQEQLSEEFNSLASYDTIDSLATTSSINNHNTAGLLNINLNDNGEIINKKTSRHKKRSYISNSNNDFDIKDNTDKTLIRGTKRKRLEDLFRPPIDLLYWGTFQAARDHAVNLNRWLIVNLQDQREFKSQVLNRDVWSDKDIKDIILSNFVLWQISMENPEGLRFKTFYHVSDCPYICIIDPRTGEERLTCDTTRPKILYDDLMKFLTENDFCLDLSLKIVRPVTSRTASSTATSNSISTTIPSPTTINSNKSNSNNNNNVIDIGCYNKNFKSKAYKTLDLSEEDQLELAIKNSLTETQCSTLNDLNTDCNDKFLNKLNQTKSNNSASLNNINESNDFIHSHNNGPPNINNSNYTSNLNEQINEKSTIVSYKDLIGNNKDSITKIQIRLPNGTRKDIEWPSSSVVKCLKLYVCEKYPDITNNTYKLIQSYPRKNILELEDNVTLVEAKLHPTSILYLHPDE